MAQSTNDVFPTATRLAILMALPKLVEHGRGLGEALARKSAEFADVLKTGRTHLQDAVPITLGQEFGGYAANVVHAVEDLERTAGQLTELNLGATAVGTGLNAGTEYTRLAVANLARDTGLPLRVASDRFRVTQSMGDVLAYSGALRRLAVEVGKIASDLRLLSMPSLDPSAAPPRSTTIGWRVKGTGVNGSGMLTCAAAAVNAVINTTAAARMPRARSARGTSASMSVAFIWSTRTVIGRDSTVCAQH